MRVLSVISGSLTAALLFYLFFCFVYWQLPAPFGDLEEYDRFFIGLIWALVTFFGGFLSFTLYKTKGH